MFHKDYIDPDKYVSLTVAAKRSGYSYGYIQRIVSKGYVKRAPIQEIIMVEVASLNQYVREHGR